MKEEKKEEKESNSGRQSKKNDFIAQAKKNPWMPAAIVLAIVLVVVLFTGGFSTGEVSKTAASNNLAGLVESQTGSAPIINSVKEQSGMYLVDANIGGQNVPVYVTKDGKYAFVQPIPLTVSAANTNSNANTNPSTNTNPNSNAPTEVPKSDKPKVELFIMSYCPYGTQMEKAILPVISALKDKADIKVRFTHFTLHGEKEDTENFRQLCIREQQGAKFLPYLQCILNSTDAYNPADQTACMQKLGINKASVDSCVNTKAKDYFAADSQLSQGYGVQGSPTLVINGVEVQSSRSPAAVLSTICSAFSTAPAECSTQLPTSQTSPGFGYSSSSSDSAAIQCGF
ncbi:thioredoxin domain-containing protein [Candidatus Pacearchaeota archaeon]|nr:thioredoxin domain-containing protein [Candidatus Pacearchaeota archaeon]